MSRFAGTASYVFGQPTGGKSGIVLLSFDELVQKNIPHCVILRCRDGHFSDLSKEGWLPAGLAVAETDRSESVIVVSNFGKSIEIPGSGEMLRSELDEKQSREAKIRQRGPLRCVRRIGTEIFVVGGDRQAYRRVGIGSWVEFDQSMKPSAKDNTVYGLESIDGFSANDLYAVGWKGEIWQFDGVRWSPQPSPTNLLLTSVCCSPDGVAYIGGREGLLLRGRAHQWDVVDCGDIVDDFWSAVWFRGELYLSGMRGIYRLVDEKLNIVDTRLDPPATFNTLTVWIDTLWSVGRHDILCFDGLNWQRID